MIRATGDYPVSRDTMIQFHDEKGEFVASFPVIGEEGLPIPMTGERVLLQNAQAQTKDDVRLDEYEVVERKFGYYVIRNDLEKRTAWHRIVWFTVRKVKSA
jgi:hypothetical protein